MSGRGLPVLAPGDEIRLGGQAYEVMALDGTSVRLADVTGAAISKDSTARSARPAAAAPPATASPVPSLPPAAAAPAAPTRRHLALVHQHDWQHVDIAAGDATRAIYQAIRDGTWIPGQRERMQQLAPSSWQQALDGALRPRPA